MAPPFEDDPNGTADIHSGAEMSGAGANDTGMPLKQPAASTTSNPARQALDSHPSTDGVAEDLSTSPETTTMVNNNGSGQQRDSNDPFHCIKRAGLGFSLCTHSSFLITKQFDISLH